MAKPKKPTKSCSKAGSKLATDRDPKAASKLARCGKAPAKKKPVRKRAPTKKECQAAGWSLAEIGSKKAGETMSACAKKAARRKPAASRAGVGTLESDTPIVPYVVATTVIEEVVGYLRAKGHGAIAERVYGRMGDSAVALSRKAETVYAANESFRKKMRAKGNAGRDQLYVWMRHWLAASLKAKDGEAYRALPRSFDLGHPLPEVKAAAVSTGARRGNPPGDFRRDLEAFFLPRTGRLGRLVASRSRAMDSTGQEGLAWTLHDPRAAAAVYNTSAEARRVSEELAAVASRHGLRPYVTDARSIRFYESAGRRDNPSRVWLFDAGPSSTPRYTMIDTDVMRVDGERQRLVMQWTIGTERSVQSSAFRNHLSESQWAALGDFSALGSRIRVADIGDRQSRSFAEDVLRAWSAKATDAAVPSGFRGELETYLRSKLGSFGKFRTPEAWAKDHDVDADLEIVLQDTGIGRAIMADDSIEPAIEEIARRHGLRLDLSAGSYLLFCRGVAGRRANPGGPMSAPSRAAYDRAPYALRVEHLRDRREVADVARAVYGDSPGVFGADDDGTKMEFRFDTAADLRRGYGLVMEDIRRHNRQASWSAREVRTGRSLLAPLAGREPWPANLR